ncbi:MAG TPA: aminopeptidase [Anaerolineales bacterium]|nr:aminopeptidase [Anaerolineales bacterium]
MKETEFDQMLGKYADVVVRIGLNLRKGQRLLIRAILDDAPLVRKVTESAYQAGAIFVDVAYTDERLTRIRLEHADPDSLTEVPNWILARFEEYYERMDAELAIASTDPELLSGIAPNLIAKYRKAVSQKMEPLRKYENSTNWCVVATASPAWAKKVFPELSVQEAQEKLWGEIFASCRIDTADPIQAWSKQVNDLKKYQSYLNDQRFAALHYKAPGTDLTLGLPEKHLWQGAEAEFKNGITGIPNLPTEEVFTTPHKEKVDGTVTATRPLNYLGALIEGFNLTFENGRVVRMGAKKGEETLRKMIETDEDAGRLGEAALVPNSSPISQRGILFYNTLFDENASCHLALGNSYRETIIGGEDMSDEEFEAQGGNKSLVHTDFMIGSDKLDIDGLKADGSRTSIMRSGEWAVEL